MSDRVARRRWCSGSCAVTRGGRARAARARPRDRALRRARPGEPLRACSTSTPRALLRELLRGSLGLAEAYMRRAVVEPRPRRARAPRARATCTRSTAAPARLRPLIGPARALGRARNTVRPQPQADRRPLRPRQRPLRAVPRRDDDVLVRHLPHPDATLDDAALHKLERVCRKLELRPERPPARDRHRLGRARRPRRARARLPRHDHDDLARAARPRRASACARPASRTA